MNALISRRNLIRAGLLAGAAVGAGGLAWLREPTLGLRVLAPEEVRVIEAMGEVMFPEGNPVGPSWRDADVVLAVDDLLADTLWPPNVPAFRYLLRTLELGTLLSRGQRFTECPPGVRLAVLEIWDQEDPFPRRLLSTSLRSVMAMAYFNHPAVQAALGWRLGCGELGAR